jgi:hypothetical protein
LKNIARYVPDFRKCSTFGWGWNHTSRKIEDNFMSLICKHACVGERYVLQVHLTATNHSRHVIAVRDRLVIDPDIGEWLPLSLKSFDKLGVDKVLRAFRKIH